MTIEEPIRSHGVLQDEDENEDEEEHESDDGRLSPDERHWGNGHVGE